jgi:hypothetical protein
MNRSFSARILSGPVDGRSKHASNPFSSADSCKAAGSSRFNESRTLRCNRSVRAGLDCIFSTIRVVKIWQWESISMGVAIVLALDQLPPGKHPGICYSSPIYSNVEPRASLPACKKMYGQLLHYETSFTWYRCPVATTPDAVCAYGSRCALKDAVMGRSRIASASSEENDSFEVCINCITDQSIQEPIQERCTIRDKELSCDTGLPDKGDRCGDESRLGVDNQVNPLGPRIKCGRHRSSSRRNRNSQGH